MMALIGSWSLSAFSSGFSKIQLVPSPRPNPLTARSSNEYDRPSGDRSLHESGQMIKKRELQRDHAYLIVESET